MGNDQITMAESSVIKEDLIKAFNQMWGKFPEPVCLIHKNRTIITTNECGKKMSGGMLTGGIKCTSMPGDHSKCRANQALKERETTSLPIEINGKDSLSYWVPVEGETEYFIHFSIGN